jgi:phosphate transport system substrate-binding protein
LGVTGALAAKPISIYGRNSASGTYGYFKEHTLKNGDYKNSVKEQPGSASVVEGVAHDIAGIGYSGIGYATSGVRVLALSDKKGARAEAANYENVLSGKYPLARMLYIYVAKKPGEPMPKVVEEFLKFALSKEGQEIVVKDGYDPLTAKMINEQLKGLK